MLNANAGAIDQLMRELCKLPELVSADRLTHISGQRPGSGSGGGGQLSCGRACPSMHAVFQLDRTGAVQYLL